MKKTFFILFVAFATFPVFSQGNVLNFEDVDDIRNTATSFSNGTVIRTRNYDQAYEGGGAFYTIETSSLADNGGEIIKITGTTKIARLVKNQRINIKQFGAKADDSSDNSQEIQAAVDYCLENYIRELYIPEGIFRIDSGIIIENKMNALTGVADRPAGLYIIGEGISSSVIRNGNGQIGESMFKIDGVNSTTGHSAYIYGGGFEGILFDGFSKGNENNHGLEIKGWWNGTVKECQFNFFLGDGIRAVSEVQLHPDENPDFSASLNLKFEQVTIARNRGYGFNDHGSLDSSGDRIGQGAAQLTFEHCYISLNQKGGAFIQSSAVRFVTCSIASNGWYSEIVPNTNPGYGILYGGTSSTFNSRHKVENCEFDNNKTAHIAINAMTNSRFVGNRFINDDRETQEINPSETSIIFAPPQGVEVSNIVFQSNFFRTRNQGEFPSLTLFDWENTDRVRHIYVRNNSLKINQVGSNPLVNVTPYENYTNGNHHLKNNYVLRDNEFTDNERVTSNGTPPAFYIGSLNGFTSPNGLSAGNNMYNLIFDKPDPNIFGTGSNNTFVTNDHYNTTTGVFTCPKTGLYRIDVQITHLNVANNERARLHVRKNGNILFSDYAWGTGNYRLNQDISSTFFALEGDQITLETGRTGSGVVQLATPESYGFNRLNIRLEE